MLKQLFSWQNGIQRRPERIRLSSYLLALYVALLPIATGLTGLISDISPLNYIAVLYLLISVVEVLMHPAPVFRKEFIFIYIYFAFALLSFLWRSDKVIDWKLTTFMTSALLFFAASGRGYNEKELKLFVIASMVSIAIVFAVTAKNFPTRSIRMLVRVVQQIDPNDFGCGLCVVIATSMAMSL